MRLHLPLIASFLLAGLAVALAAPAAAASNLTPVSMYQNASVFVNTSTANMTLVGTFDNATVYRSGGANATLLEHSIRFDLGSAPELGYRDVYLFVRMPVTAFDNVTFDYDIVTGDKSNVLLVDFNASLPRTGIVKGGLKDHAVFGLGTWSDRYGEIGGLHTFPQGAHHVEIATAGSELVLRIDGQGVAVASFKQQAYLLIHLMTGDGASYLRGTISNLTYSGPPPVQASTSKPPVIPPFNISATVLPHPGTVTPVPAVTLSPGSDPEASGEATPQSKLLPGVNFGFAIVAAIALLLAWVFIYFKYINK